MDSDTLLAARILKKNRDSNVSMARVQPLWIMSRKLKSSLTCSNDKCVFFRSLSLIPNSLYKPGRDSELSKIIPLYDLSKNSESSFTSVEPDDISKNLEIQNFFALGFDERNYRVSDVRKDDFCEKPVNSYCCSENEIEMQGDEFGRDNAVSVALNLGTGSTLSGVDIASSLHIQKDYASEESNDSIRALKEGCNEHENEIAASGDTVELGNCKSSREASNLCLLCGSEVEEDNFSFELCLPSKETSKLDHTHSFPFTFDDESCVNISSKCRSSNSDIYEENFSEEAGFPLKETDPHRITATASDFSSCTDRSNECISSYSDVHKDRYSEEADFPFKEETGPQKSVLTTDFYSSTEISNRCISSNFGRQFFISGESFKIANLIEFAQYLRGNEYSKKRMSTSFENSEGIDFYFYDQTDFTNVKLLQNQFLCAKKCATDGNLGQEEEFSESKNSKIQKDYSEDYFRTSIFGEAKELLKREFLEYLQETIDEISSTQDGIYLQLPGEPEFLKEHPSPIHVTEEAEGQHSNVKMDYSAEKTSKCGALDNDLVQQILFSVYDFICEIEGNASFCMEKQNLISELQAESEDICSEPDCVKSVRILLYFLDTIKLNLEARKDEASKLQLNFEDVAELYSYEFKNTVEGKELQKTARKFISECDKVYEGIEKDLADCKWYYKSLEKILDFYQNNCCFIGSPGV